MSFLTSRTILRASRTSFAVAPRAFSTSFVARKSATESVKDTVKTVDRKVSDVLVDGIEAGRRRCKALSYLFAGSTGPPMARSTLPHPNVACPRKKNTAPANLLPLTENATQKAKEVAGMSTSEMKSKANEVAGEAKGKANEVAGQAQGKANELAGEAKGKANEVAGQAQGKKEEIKGKM
ncbi:hypothetical protein VTL71DRAFT_11472 [Oculimacula yallundae]|uniref:LEA domain protein n=1 Tax=Oculimacula yallundae TaxID=86028 RepID=A0ABR4CQB0_9HELO